MQRDNSIDIMRGIGIILVVLGHTSTAFNNWIYLFHVPLFFIISGYCFKEEDDLHVVPRIIKKIKSLYLPYLIYGVAFVLLNNLFIKIGFYCTQDSPYLSSINNLKIASFYSCKDIFVETLKILLFVGGTPMSGPMWFLRVMFLSSLIYLFLYMASKRVFANKNDVFRLIGSLLLSALGFVLSFFKITLYANIGSVFSSIIFYEAGLWLKRLNIKSKVYYFTAFPAILVIVLIGFFFKFDLGNNQISNLAVFYVVCLSGWFLVRAIALVLNKCFMRWALSLIGRCSLHIMCLHLLSFKIVSLIYILITRSNFIYLACYPVIDNCILSFPYVAIGVFIPLLFSVCLRKIIHYIYLLNNNSRESKSRI